MAKITARCQIISGKLIIYDRDLLNVDLGRCVDGDYLITIDKLRKKRSNSANSLFHVYCQEIADETGQDMETVKATVKQMYARKPMLDANGEHVVDKETGDVAMYVQDTRDMNSLEMYELTENTRLFAMDFFGIVLKLPEEQTELKFKKNEK
jgi:hypothetical protein